MKVEQMVERFEMRIKSELYTMNYGIQYEHAEMAGRARERIIGILIIFEDMEITEGYSAYALESCMEEMLVDMEDGEAVNWITKFNLIKMIEMFNELSE